MVRLEILKMKNTHCNENFLKKIIYLYELINNQIEKNIKRDTEKNNPLICKAFTTCPHNYIKRASVQKKMGTINMHNMHNSSKPLICF